MTRPRVVVVTLRDAHAEHATTYLRPEQMRGQLLRDPSVTGLDPAEYVGQFDAPGDVVRARSNAVAYVLRELPDATHILWWDDDVVPRSLETVGRLVRSGHDVVGCPVPRKRVERWGEADPHWRGEADAYDYAYRVDGLDGGTEARTADVRGCIEVDALPFGLMLTSTRALRAMTGQYADLWYTHAGARVAALFQLLLTEPRTAPDGSVHRELLSEDYSFCARWRDLGGHVHMLLDPCTHIGGHAYRGHFAGLRHCR